MSNSNYFDAGYVGEEQTSQPVKEQSQVKRLLKDATSEEEMARYGTSKPKRVVVRGKIIDDKS